MSNLLINKLTSQHGNSITEEELKEWERKTGYTLPKDYRKFLLQYNGGMIKPWLFRHDHPEVFGNNQEMLLDHLHDWHSVIESSYLDIPPDMSSRPPNHIEIGVDPGGGRIMLSLKSDNNGNVVYWLPTYMEWGVEPNNVLGSIAHSFTEFLQKLYDDGETEHGKWEVIVSKHPSISLIL